MWNLNETVTLSSIVLQTSAF